MTWIWNRAITKAWTLHPWQDRKDSLCCLLGRSLLNIVMKCKCLLVYYKNYTNQAKLHSYSQDLNWTQAEMADAGSGIRLWVSPTQLEPCPAATETDIHANHNRNERPDQTTTHLGSHFNWPASLPACQTISNPTRGSTPVPAQTDWDKLGQSPPPLPPTLPLHCALQQPLLRGLIPRSDHHLSLLCWHN